MLLSVPAPAALVAGCTATLSRLHGAAVAIEARDGRATVATVLLPLESAMADAGDALAIDRYAAVAAADPAARAAAVTCLGQASAASGAVESSPRLFAALQRVAGGGALRRYWLRRFKHAGAAVAPEHRAEFARLQAELRDLQARFDGALARDTTSITVSRRDLGGVPETLLATFERRRNGSAIVPVNDATRAFLRDAQSESARRAYWEANRDRVRAAAAPVLERLVTVRDRLAHLAGAQTWADYELDEDAITALQAEKGARAMRSDTDAAAPWNAAHAIATGAGPEEPVVDLLATAFTQAGAPLGVTVASAGPREYRVTDALGGGPLGTIVTAPAPDSDRTPSVTVLLPARGTGAQRREPLVLLALPARGTLPSARTPDLSAAAGVAIAATLAQSPYASLNGIGGARGQLIEAVFERLAGGSGLIRDSAAALAFSESGARAGAALAGPGSDRTPEFLADFIDGDAALLTNDWAQGCAGRLTRTFDAMTFRRDVLDPAASEDLAAELAKLQE